MSTINDLALSAAALAIRLVKRTVWRGRTVFAVPPASAGSLGDEALLAGLHALVSARSPYRVRQVTLPGWTPLPSGGLERDALTAVIHDTTSRLRFMFRLLACRHFTVLGADVMDGWYNPQLVQRLVDLCNLAARVGTPTTILGFSFSENPAPLAVAAIRQLHPAVECCCRDPLSLQRLYQHAGRKGRLVADLAFGMEPDAASATVAEALAWIREQRARDALVIGFNVNPLVGKELAASYLRSLVDLLQAEPRLACIFLPHDLRAHISDLESLAALREALPEPLRDRTYLLKPPFDARQVKAVAGHVDLVVSGRMHLAIASLSQGVPAIGITYQGKFEGLFGFFDMTELLMAPDDLKSEGALKRKVLDAVGQIVVYRNRIAGSLPEVRRLSAANVEQIIAHDARARISRYVASTAARLYRSATSRRPASAIRLR